jgi:DNA-binding transcriptional LysR family regulator
MRLEWLEDILAVAETGSFSEAAERRHLTQSAFSRRIRIIEDYVGAELFDRARKPVQLRPTTEDQRERIVFATSLLRQLLADLRRGDRRRANRLVIASQHALTTALTPAILQSVQARHEDVFVRLRSANLDDCFAMLLARQADIALVYRIPGSEHPIEADYIETLPVGMDRLIPVCSRAAVGMIETARLPEGLPVIAYPAEVFFGQVFEREIMPRLGLAAGVVPKVETALTLAALEMAAVGIGVAWVPASLSAPQVHRGDLVDLSSRLPSCDLQVTAVRLAGATGRAEVAVWEVLRSLHPQGAT